MMRKLFITLLFCSIFAPMVAQEVLPDTVVAELKPQITFMEELLQKDSITGATVTVYQDAQLEQLINTPRTGQGNTHKGFRVQLFSSNMPQNARATAFAIEKKVLTKHPDFAIYVTYKAPFWKVRVGDCITYEAAVQLRQFMAAEFPELKSEIYIVPDQINIK